VDTRLQESPPWGDAVIDEAFIRRAVELAEPNALRVALYQITGDPELLGYELEERKVWRISRQSIVTVVERDRAKVQEKACRWLVDHLDELESFVEEKPDDEKLRLLLREGLGVDPDEMRTNNFDELKAMASFEEWPLFFAHWTDGRRPEIPADFKVAIVGAGFNGLATAILLDQLGIPFVMYERRPEVGGTWSNNRYPEVRVDGASTTYQLGFVKRHPWTEYYAQGPEVRDYIEMVAKRYGVFDRIQLSTEVTSLVWNEETSRWDIEARRGERVLRESANVIAGATGLFNKPRDLVVEGLSDFAGDVLHTARWPEPPYDFTGKRVAVIGNGSTGVQLVKPVAEVAAELYHVVRTPKWIQPQVNYGEKVQPELTWLLQRMPYYWNWDRFMWTAPVTSDSSRDLQRADPEWQAKGGIYSKASDELRFAILDYWREQLDGDEELVARLTPDYPPWGQRMVTDNGWFTTLRKDHVHLLLGSIDHVDAEGVVMEDGTRADVDVIIAASGFDVDSFMSPIRIVGRGGETLEERWEREGKGPRAFNALNVPGFPNLFVMYGPNAEGGAGGGSVTGRMQLWANNLATLTVHLIEKGYRSFSVKEEVYEAHNAIIDERNSRTVAMEPNAVRTSYRVSHGRLQVASPWTPKEHWEAVVHPDMERDFDIT